MRFRARAPHSLDAARKVLGRLLETSSPSHGFQKHSKALDGHLQKYSTPAGLDYEELGDLSDPGATELLIGIECSGGGGRTQTTPRYPVSTRTAVELA